MTSMFLLGQESFSQWRFLMLGGYLLLTLVLPFVVGRLIANALRMKDYGWKIGLILCFTIVALVILGRTWDPKKGQFVIPQGVDLKGGVILIYEVDNSVKIADDTQKRDGFNDPQDADDDQVAFSMSALIEALSRRINPSGTKEIVVRPYGSGQVEIIIPEVDTKAIDQIKKVISTAGVLQFRIVANSRDHQDVLEAAREIAQDPVKRFSRIVYDDAGEPIGLWARVAREQAARRGVRPFKVDVSGFTVRDSSSGELLNIPPDFAGASGSDDDSRRQLLAEYVSEKNIKEIDVLMAINDGLNVNGAHLGSVMKSKDEFMNPDILFNLKGAGIKLFEELTGRFKPDGAFSRQLGIVLDNELLSAPNIQEQISQHGRITGRFTDEEVTFLVNILEAGSLPVVLNKEPISESTISPLLGRETIEQGKMAIVVATLLIFVFMLAYYRFSGLLACMALVLNIVFTLAIMVLIKAPLTLPGLAGLVLTVGMAVDANVLIFERMREELARGTALRMTIRNGFSRATATIIDSNMTTILTAVILYAIGTDQLRGFSVALILGILTSMFTAIFCTRVAFDIVERHRILSTLKMFQFIGATKLDFIGKWRIAIVASTIVIVVGLAGAIVRGRDLFDIDFTGGSSVHVTLEQPADSEDVRALLDKKFQELKTPYTLTGMSVTAGQTQSRIFKVDAKIDKVDQLEEVIKQAFQDSSSNIRLARYSLKYGELKTVAMSSPSRTSASDTPSAEKSDPPAAAPGSTAPSPATTPQKAEASNSPAGDTKTADGKAQEANSGAVTSDAATSDNSKASTEKANTEKTDTPQTDAASDKSTPEGEARRSLPAATLLALNLQDSATPAVQDPPAGGDSKADADKNAGAATTERQPSAGREEPAAEKAASTSTSPATEQADAPGVSAPSGGTLPDKPAAPSASVGQVEVTLTFEHEINEPTLRAEIESAAEKLQIPLSYFTLLNPDWQPGSSNPFDKWTLRISATMEDTKRILENLQDSFADTPVWSSSNKIGPQVAGRMQRTAIVALVASWIGIVIYVWIRFQNLVYGLAAVIALVHDVLVTVAAIAVSSWLAGALGFLLIEDFKISLTIVAALLTIIGYSINDTIVIFDRLREVKGKSPDVTVEMLNLTLNQTLSRTILTAFTVFLTVIVLYGFGGQGIHGFAFSMLIGVISGTYSTIYIASPFVLWLAGKSTESKTKSAAA